MKVPETGKNSGGSGIEYPKLAKGCYVAQLFAMIDMGTHSFTWEGKENSQRKLMIGFNLPDELYDITQADGAVKTYAHKVWAEFSFTMGERAKLRQFISGYAGKMEDRAAYNFDFSSLLGKFMLLNTDLVESKTSGKFFVNALSVSVLPKAVPQPSVVIDNLVFSLEKELFNQHDLDRVPKWVQGKIEKSPEYERIIGSSSFVGKFSSEPMDLNDVLGAPPQSVADADDDDDLPF